MKSILISIPWFTPAYKAGGPVQSVLNMVNQCNEELNFSVVTADTDIDDILLPITHSNKWIYFNDHTKVIYISAQNRYRKLIAAFKSKKYEVAFLTGIYSFSFTLLPLFFNCASRYIISVRGMLHPSALSQKKFKKKIYLSILKPILILKKVEFHATDENEKEYILTFMGEHAKVWIAQNIPKILESNVSSKQSGKLRLLTVALIGPMKNYLEVLKALSEITAEIEYDICGPVYWPEYWAECQKIIANLPKNIKVNYHGAIPPEKLSPLYAKAHVFICPSQSENFGHAIYEAFSAGKPVITSFNTPWNDLKKQEIGLNIQPQKEEIIEAVDFFCKMDNTEFTLWSKNAASYARKSVVIDVAKQNYKKMFNSTY
jgi:glycosyltransferase involved in cell wall biosynthesis